MRICLIALLLCAGACRSGDEVDVTGAVLVGGRLPYTVTWTAQKYIQRAGGFDAQADTGAISVSRVLPGTPIEDALDYRRRFDITLQEAGDIRPGDHIVVPYQTYVVRLDSVLRISKFDLTTGGRTYRIPDGYWIPGWTDPGVMAGVLIGRGEILEDQNQISMFHYIYLQMHPAAFSSIFRTGAGTPETHPEILEDAAEIHRTLFMKGDYQLEGRALLPPEGFLHFQAGVWLAPKSKTYPGPGMRKRKYADGREWTTYGDGRQRVIHPDGKVVKTFPGGSRWTRFGGGRVVYEDESGNQETRFPDGKEVWVTASGNRVTTFSDGGREYRNSNGDVRIVLPNGTDRTTFAEGIVHTRFPDGRVEVRDPDGQVENRFPDGRIVARTANGTRITVHPDGSRLARMTDGSEVELFTDGTRIQRNATGERVEVFSDGRRKISFPDGTEMIRHPDGYRQIRYADQTHVDLMPDGREIRRDADGRTLVVHPDGHARQTDTLGTTIEIFPDGSRIETDAEGNRMEMEADGTWLKTFVEPYAYRGSMRQDLIGLESCPEAITPGEKIEVSGTVADTVIGLELAVFELPRGDVVSSLLKLKKGRFEGSLRLRKPGFYRLQILAEVGVSHTETVTDRMLRVGSPQPLGSPILRVEKYSEMDEAAELAVQLINNSRRELGRSALHVHPWLTRAAEYRVSEMRALRYFSHVSPNGKNAAALARSGEVRFSKVGENIGQGPSVEDVHDQLMLSAGHRRNILGRQWTDVGVVAVEEGGMVWVVQIFADR